MIGETAFLRETSMCPRWAGADIMTVKKFSTYAAVALKVNMFPSDDTSSRVYTPGVHA